MSSRTRRYNTGVKKDATHITLAHFAVSIVTPHEERRYL